MQPYGWAKYTRRMRQWNPQLDHSAESTATLSAVPDGDDPCLQSLLRAVSRWRTSSQGAVPEGPSALTFDRLGESPYHAVLVAYLAKRAIHAPPPSGESPATSGASATADEARRMTDLDAIIEAHSLPWASPKYSLFGLCYSPLSPAALVIQNTTLYVANSAT